jgi:hypothetical protein
MDLRLAAKATRMSTVTTWLEGARAARSDKETARRAVAAALEAADTPEARLQAEVAAYKFHFYNTELEGAAPHAAACIALYAAPLGVSGDWRQVQPGDYDFGAFEASPRKYVQAIIAFGYCRARLGHADGREALVKAAELDPFDRFGAKRLIAVIDRGGIDPDDEDMPAVR